MKYLCFEMLDAAAASSSVICAVSRRINCPSRTTTAPPLRSAGVRRTVSAANGAPLSSNHCAISALGAAPRLSTLEMLRYSKPCSTSSVSTPEVASTVYTSPCPGGHHSSSGSCGKLTGSSVSSLIFGSWFCSKLSGRPSTGNVGYFESAASESASVRKLLRNISGSCTWWVSRAQSTWSTMKSRKVLPSRTSSSDFAC